MARHGGEGGASKTIAHDLRTPLTRLRQRLELGLRKAASPEELRAVIARSLADADALLATFSALLSIAQLESGTRRERFGPIDLTELLESVVELYQLMADEKRQTLAVAIAPRMVANGDRELLAQMFANLLENAMRHSPEGTAIALAAKHGSACAAEVLIADNPPPAIAAVMEAVLPPPGSPQDNRTKREPQQDFRGRRTAFPLKRKAPGRGSPQCRVP